MKIAIIIPARGGSRGIPQKNMRRLGGRPLISFPIENALKLKKNLDYDIDIAVTSEDELIEEYVKNIYPSVFFIKRAGILAKDDTILDPVVYNAFLLLKEKTKRKYDFILTLLSTTPLLSVSTIKKAIDIFYEWHTLRDSLVLVNQRNHIFWDNNCKLITERKNRQFLEPIFEEIGGLVITQRQYLMKYKKWISENSYLYVCPPDESIDINNWHDLILAEKLLNRKKIGFHVSGSHKKGLGHVYRCITLALRLIEHEIFFLIDKKDKEAINLVESYFFKAINYKDIYSLVVKIKKENIRVIINDTLGVDSELASNLFFMDIPLISIDDNENNLCALIINPEYEFTGPWKDCTSMADAFLFGYRYSVIREDVLMFPVKNCPDNIKNILVTMGGSDPEGATVKIIEYLNIYPDIHLKNITVVLGKYFSDENREQIKNLSEEYNFEIIEDVRFMGVHLYNADLVITSNSSTVYDCVALGTFTVAVSKTQEEIAHLFSRVSNAVVYLGYHKDLNQTEFKKAIVKFNYDPYKLEIYNSLVKYANEIRMGQQVVIDKIKEVIEE